MRGGEAILEALCSQYPSADLFTLLQTDFHMTPQILEGRKVVHSYLQGFMRWERFRRGYRSLLPLFPHAIQSLDLSSYDIVISNTHCVAKGVRKKPGAFHISYVSTPMRYMWDLFDDYFGPGKSGAVTTWGARMLKPYLRRWDVESTKGVDVLLANSTFVQDRIRRFWGRESKVLHPFFSPEKFDGRFRDPGDYYLIVSAFAPYKKIDLAVEAFAQMGRRLLVVGKGQDEEKLRELAKGKSNIEFLGSVPDSALGELYQRARGFVFPGLEDFGITPLEAMFNGCPVVAYGRGGVLDTVTDRTGEFFSEQSIESLMGAVERMEARWKNPENLKEECRKRSLQFSREAFLQGWNKAFQQGLERHRANSI
jgi:glycosyltransferase involved in cell wall biosynthesis